MSLGRAGSATDHLLSLGSIVTHILLGDLGVLRGALGGSVADLGRLGRDDIGSLLDSVVDKLLVGLVDQGHEEEGRGGNQGQTPIRDDLDEIVGDESTKGRLSHVSMCPTWRAVLRISSRMQTYSSRGIDILSEEDALGLDNEKVDELVHISNHRVKGLSRDRIVLAGAELSSQAVVQERLSDNLSGNGDAEHHPRELEAPSEEIQVPKREYEGDDGGKSNRRGT